MLFALLPSPLPNLESAVFFTPLLPPSRRMSHWNFYRFVFRVYGTEKEKGREPKKKKNILTVTFKSI